jgi:hypothetical protein
MKERDNLSIHPWMDKIMKKPMMMTLFRLLTLGTGETPCLFREIKRERESSQARPGQARPGQARPGQPKNHFCKKRRLC